MTSVCSTKDGKVVPPAMICTLKDHFLHKLLLLTLLTVKNTKHVYFFVNIQNFEPLLLITINFQLAVLRLLVNLSCNPNNLGILLEFKVSSEVSHSCRIVHLFAPSTINIVSHLSNKSCITLAVNYTVKNHKYKNLHFPKLNRFLERKSVMSCYHGSKISGSQQQANLCLHFLPH